MGKVLKMGHSTVQHAFHEAVAGSMMNLEKVCVRARRDGAAWASASAGGAPALE